MDWDAETTRQLKSATAAAFRNPAIARVALVCVDDLLEENRALFLNSLTDLEWLRRGVIPPRGIYTASWWRSREGIEPRCDRGTVTIGNHRQPVSDSRGLVQVVTIDSLGPPDACCPMVFRFDPLLGSFELLSYRVFATV